MTITGGSALPKDDIERMMRDAEAHAEEDKRRREEAETRNLAESLQYQTEKFLAENGDKIPADKKEELVIVIFCSLPVPRSFADTFMMPFASMSNVTSTCGTPRGAGAIPSSAKRPIVLFSDAIGRSPCRTWTSTCA